MLLLSKLSSFAQYTMDDLDNALKACQHLRPRKRHLKYYSTFVDRQINRSSSTACSLIARFMGPAWGPSGANRTKMGPMLAPWTLLSGLSPENNDVFQQFYYNGFVMSLRRSYNISEQNRKEILFIKVRYSTSEIKGTICNKGEIILLCIKK